MIAKILTKVIYGTGRIHGAQEQGSSVSTPAKVEVTIKTDSMRRKVVIDVDKSGNITSRIIKPKGEL